LWYIVSQNLGDIMFGYLKHKQKTLEFAWQHFETQNTFWIKKIILIQQLDEEDWIKLVYIKYITYIFLTTIKLHICGTWNITKILKMVPNLIDIYQCHSSQNNPPTTLVLKYICKISNSMIGIISSHIYSICSKSSRFVI
jgi:hypothetical protein